VPSHLPITILASVMTAAAIAATALAWHGLAVSGKPRSRRWTAGLIGVALAAAAAAIGVRWTGDANVVPVEAYVDVLLLIGVALAAVLLPIHRVQRFRGLAAAALPLLALVSLWAVCASAWTYRAFGSGSLGTVWGNVHLVTVSLGTMCCLVAAGAAGLFLYVHHQLKRRKPAAVSELASLETLETVVVRGAALGFGLLGIGVVSGLIVLTGDRAALEHPWWFGPKLVLAALAWAAFAVVMTVRHAGRFRGVGAAWITIGGVVLLFATYGVVNALPDPTPTADRSPPRSATEPTRGASSAAESRAPHTEVS